MKLYFCARSDVSSVPEHEYARGVSGFKIKEKDEEVIAWQKATPQYPPPLPPHNRGDQMMRNHKKKTPF